MEGEFVCIIRFILCPQLGYCGPYFNILMGYNSVPLGFPRSKKVGIEFATIESKTSHNMSYIQFYSIGLS